jgi:hypothetical protein
MRTALAHLTGRRHLEPLEVHPRRCSSSSSGGSTADSNPSSSGGFDQQGAFDDGANKQDSFEVTVPEGFIAPVLLRDGRLFSVDGDMNALFSKEGGRVWDAHGPIVDDDANRDHDAGQDSIGSTWKQQYLDGRPGTQPHNLCRLKSGAIGLVYWQRDLSRSADTDADWNQAFFRKSTDEALTWSPPVPIAPAHTPSYPTFLVQLESGRVS